MALETVNSDLSLDGVHDSVVHDVLDVLLLGDLEELLSVGGGRKIFCGSEEEELILYVLEDNALMITVLTGLARGASDQVMSLEGTAP